MGNEVRVGKIDKKNKVDDREGKFVLKIGCDVRTSERLLVAVLFFTFWSCD